MSAKVKYGYVVAGKGSRNYLAKNGSMLAVLGDQSSCCPSEAVCFFVTKPSRNAYSARRFVIRQASRVGRVVTLFNHSYREEDTLNTELM